MDAYLPPHQKYGYNAFQQVLMLVITGITNFAGVPACILLYKTRRYFETYIAFFTLLTSFMYHAMESVDMKRFFLNEGEWHRLDNIGSISAFMLLFIHLMDNQDPKLDFHLYMSSFLIAILAQERDPWNINYTLGPIFLAIISFFIVIIRRKRKPLYNKRMLFTAMVWLLIGSINFNFGLDEFKDHLRFYHGMWHLCVSISSFYFWQIKIIPGEEFTLSSIWKKEYNAKCMEYKPANLYF